VFADPQVVARGMQVTMEHPARGDLPLVANPIRMSASPVAYRRPPPGVGQQTEEVLADWLGQATD
jgi:crotonobetainyl-CoA:carnitine CoA-transferase CaiB-like acyl-CoA transferase